MKNTLAKSWENSYLEKLRQLASRRSVFTNREEIELAMNYCESIFDLLRKTHEVYKDKGGNLIAMARSVDVGRDVVYLSAHIDTVDAKAELWNEPYSPFEVFEDENEIVGRGVNDCKAGVAFILWVAELIAEGLLNGNQIVLTITFKEEGPGEKTALEIGRELGKSLPVSKQDTYLIVLENNVRVKEKPVLCVYASERSNYAVEVDGTLSEIKRWLRQLPNFNPVSCLPTESFDVKWSVQTQQGGHICSVPREENLLMKIINEAKFSDLIRAGESGNFSVVPAEISHSEHDEEVIHTLVMGNRSFDSVERVEADLEILPPYKRLKPFEYACGFNTEKKFKRNKASDLLVCSEEVEIELTYNVGSSDGTHIFAMMDEELKENFYPIVMGPGSRSQRELDPPRLTHGVNETFDKKSGQTVCLYLIEKIRALTE